MSSPRPHLRRWALLAATGGAGCFAPTGSSSGTDPATTSTTAPDATTTTTLATTAASSDAASEPAPTTGTSVSDQGMTIPPCPALTALDLENGLGGFVIRAEDSVSTAGFAVTGIGDFDKDGRDDLRIQAMPPDDPVCESTKVWRNYIVHGKDDGAPVQLDSGPASPFVSDGLGRFIDGSTLCQPPCDSQFGYSLAGLGDLDGDGHADLAVGAALSEGASGRVYVFHGRQRDGENLVVSDVGPDPKDYALAGAPAQVAGFGLAALGDIDGDDIPDLGFHSGGLVSQRSVHVRYGGEIPAADPHFLAGDFSPADGYAILDPAPDDVRDFGLNLDGGHDFNGDDVPDLLLDTGPDDATRLVVVFGSPGRTQGNTSLDDFIAAGRTTIIQCSATCGHLARFVGDIDGDGLADIAAGQVEFDTLTGRVVVVFGSTVGRVVNIDALEPADGFVVVGESGGDFFGNAVAGADLNGDGIDDLVIGAPGFQDNQGRVYVAFGRPDFAGFALKDVVAGLGGFVIDGLGAEDTMFGASLDRAGRLDADAIDDLVIGAPAVASLSCAVGEADGRAYALFGGSCRG